MTEPSRAVFLSYASQDADAAIRICTTLRAADIEVWFDQSELRGGEAWDASIRRQVKSCRLFLPVISASTQAREEGYFRREWNLAVSRTLDMAHDAAFLLPVVIDSTRDNEARVPEKFRDVQWTRAPAGETPSAFVERVRTLLYGAAAVSSVSPSKAATPEVSVASEPCPPRKASATTRSSAIPWLKILAFALPVLALITAAATLIPAWQKREHARTVLLPQLQDKVSTMSRSDGQIFEQAVEIENDLPRDPTLAKLWPSIANTLTVDTDPATAQVFWKDYDTPGAAWRSAGTTPFKGVKVPRTFLRLEVKKAGYQTIELAVPRLFPYAPITQGLKLDPIGSLPERMVRIPRSTTNMDVVGLETYGPKDVPEFLIDKFEVTNKQFKAFVDAGGYKDQKYWTVPINERARDTYQARLAFLL